MSTLVLDTNIVSFLMNDHPLARRHLEGRTLAISFMTMAEMYHGAYRARWGRNRFVNLERVFGNYMLLFANQEVCRLWGEIRFQSRRRPISAQDAWIAATAIANDCSLVTHNPVDFTHIPELRIVTADA